jgi:hypothetical protein
LATALTNAEAGLDREIKATGRRNESAHKAAARRAEHHDARRRQAEKRHAQEIAMISQPVVRYVHEVRTIPAPKPEVLRVLYLTANPELDLRTEVEVRDVRQAVRAATHRDLIEIIPMPAATPADLLDGLNDVRPHVVHLSSHAGEETVVFDNASIESPAGREVTFDLLAKALGATGDPPVLLVLNGCDTLDGAEVLLESTPVIIAMAEDFTCWQFDGERWLINVCNWEPVDDLAEVPDRGSTTPARGGHLISIGLEPINASRAGWAFLNRVITALVAGSHGLGFDVFTGEPIR